MEKPDMVLIIGDIIFCVILGILALVSMVVSVMENRLDGLLLALVCALPIWPLAYEIKEELKKNN